MTFLTFIHGTMIYMMYMIYMNHICGDIFDIHTRNYAMCSSQTAQPLIQCLSEIRISRLSQLAATFCLGTKPGYFWAARRKGPRLWKQSCFFATICHLATSHCQLKLVTCEFSHRLADKIYFQPHIGDGRIAFPQRTRLCCTKLSQSCQCKWEGLP